MFDIKAIIFDMDGTICDTEKLYLDTIKQVLRSYEVEVGDDELSSIVGKPLEDYENFVIDRIGQDKAEEFRLKYAEILKSYLTQYGTPLKYGLKNLIDYAIVSNIKLAIATSATKEAFDLNFDNSGLEKEKFECVLTFDDITEPKPNKEIYAKTCERLGLEPCNCLVVEDSYVGAKAGKDAGCIVSMVKDLVPTDVEKDREIDLKFYNLNEIIDFLKFNKIDCRSYVEYRKENKKDELEIARCKKLIYKYNKIKWGRHKKSQKVLSKIFGKMGNDCSIISPFYCDFGYNIEIGDKLFTNHGVCMLDCGKITIGNNCRFGPYSGIYNVGHAYEPSGRINGEGYSKKVYIGNNVWLGANATVLPGVKIGDNAVVGAGAVVVHDVMPNTVVAGNPAKFIKFIM